MKKIITFLAIFCFINYGFTQTGSAGSGSHNLEVTVDYTNGNSDSTQSGMITVDGCDADAQSGLVTLSATYNDIAQTSNYGVQSIPFNPTYPTFNNLPGGIALTIDDRWSGNVPLDFDFEFYQTDRSNVIVSANGAISFDITNANNFHGWQLNENLPTNTDPCLGPGNIFGAAHDMNPAVDIGSFEIAYAVIGTAPFRSFVFSFYRVPHFLCNTATRSTQMMVFYETTNVVEMYILQKPTCAGWNGGNATIGVQNDAGTIGTAAPGRNTLDANWDGLIEAWQFSPNAGASITTFAWLDSSGAVVGTDPTMLVVDPSIAETYTAAVTYTDAINGTLNVASSIITFTGASCIDEICVGETAQLTGTGTPNATTPWVSSDTTIATVDNTGLVTSISAGMVDITYTEDDNSQTITSITINPLPTITGTLSACEGDTTQLTGSGTASTTTPWVSSDTAIATVDNTGLVTGVANGTSDITYTDDNGCSVVETITINDTPTITGTLSVCEGDTTQLTGSGTANATTPWVSSDTAIATVDNTGLVTGVANGTSDITYTDDNGCSVVETITINDTPTITGTLSVCEGDTTQLTGSGTANATTPWVSSDTAIATVDNTGLVTGVANGTSDITYTDDNGCSVVETITINDTPTITGTLSVCEGDTTQLTGSGTANATTPWVSSDTAIATVDTTGLVTGVANGTSDITYTDDNGCSIVETITINDLPTITSLTSNTSTCSGGNAVFTITGTAGDEVAYSGVTGTPTSPVTLDASGMATVTVNGVTTDQTITLNTVTNSTTTCSASLTNMTTVTITATPTVTLTSNMQVCSGDDAVFTITGTPGDVVVYSGVTGTPASPVTLDASGMAIITVTAPTANQIITLNSVSNPTTGCNGTLTNTETVTVNALPTITVSSAATCSADLLTYDVEVTVGSGTVISTSGTVANTSGNIWAVTGVTSGTDITLTVTDANTCVNTLAVTAPDCSCPVLTAPVSGGDMSYCIGSAIPTLTATVGTGEEIDWYDAASAGALLLANSTSFTPTMAGMYYAETRELATGCTSSTRTTITLTENALPLAPVTAPIVYCLNDTATAITTSVTSTDTLTWYSDAAGITTITEPVIDTSVAGVTSYWVSQTDGNSCESTLSEIVVTINALPIAPTTTPIVYCLNETGTAAITASVAATETLTWYSDATGTTTIAEPTINTSTAGVTSYWVSQTDGNICESTLTEIQVTINALPAITVSSAATCSADLLTYDVEVTVGSGTVISTSGTVANTSGNIWAVTGVTSGTDITLTVTDANTCVNTLAVTAPDCSCPVLTAPVSGGDMSYCIGSAIPTLTATVGTGEEIDWYDAASAGALLLANSTSFTPTMAGMYYAETRELATGCTSSTRTTITLTENALPLAPVTAPIVYCLNDTATAITTSVTSTDTLTWYSDAAGITTITEPVIDTSVAGVTSYWVSQTDGNSCESTLSEIVVTINALPIAPTTTPIVYCLNETGTAAITASVAATETLTWYSDATGTTTIAEPTINTSTAGVTSYWVSQTDGNICESTLTEIQVTINALPLAPVTAPIVYCLNDTATAITTSVTASGTLTWYSDAAGITTITEPVIDTSIAGVTSYWVSQTDVNSCISGLSEIVITINVLPVLANITDILTLCDDGIAPVGQVEMDLTSMDDSFSGGDVNYLVTYYNSASAADAGTPEVLPSSSAYLGTDGETVFVRVEDITTGCYDASATLVLRVVDAPPANTPIQLASCDSDNDHVSSFNLNDATAGITTDPTLEVTYHLTQENAEDDVLALVEPELSTYENNIDLTQAPDNLSYSQIIWVRVDYLGSTADCPTVLPLELLVNETPDILANPPMDYELCDDDSDGFVEFNLPTRNVEILNGLTAADYQVTYYTDVADAEIGVTATSYIASPASFTNAVIDGQVLGVRVEDISGNNPDCYRSTTLEIIVNPLPVIAGRDLLLALCDNTAPMNDSMADFDLTEMDNQITGSDASLTVDYYENPADVLSNTPIADYTVYTGTANQTLQVVVTAMNGCTDRTTLTLRVLSNPSPTTAIPNTVLCDDAVADGITLFDLTDNGNGAGSQETFIINGELPRPTLTYHLEETDAELGINSIPDPTMHENTASPNSQLIYVRVTNGNVDTFGENCYTVVSFTIVVEPLPNVSGLDVADIKLIGCELDGDDLYAFDLTQNTTVLEDWLTSNGQTPSDYYISYHNSDADAIAGTSEIINTTAYINELPGMPGVSENPQTIYVRITDGSDALGTGGTGCYLDTVNFEIEVQDGAISNQSLTDYVICDNIGTVNDGIAQFNLSSTANGDIYDYNVGHTLHADILNSNPLYVQDPLDFRVSFYSTAEGAEFGVGHIDQLPETYENTTSANQQIIYVRVDNNTTTNDVCYDVSTLILMVNPLPVLDLDESYLLCTSINGSEVVTTPPTIDTGLDVANYSFIWSLDGTQQPQFNDMSSIEPTQGGTYSVLVTDRSTGCDNSISSADTYTTTVNESSPPLVAASVVTAAFATNHGIEVTAENQSTTNVISEYEFSLNDGEWQLGTGTVGGTYTHTFLDDVRLGENNIKVRDINGCGMSEINITVMDYPLYFTPNGDGIHETWNISAPESPINYLATAKIYIFDRFGKLLKQLNPSGAGWDGTYNGEAMPTSDYWFTVDYVDPLDDAQKQFKAHFTLKR